MDSFDPQLFRVEEGVAQLSARTCRDCRSTTLVASQRCALCQGPTEISPITGGTVAELCEAQFELHGFAPPVQIAQVRCEPHIDIVGICTERVKIGDEVILASIPVESSAGTFAGYAFQSVAGTVQVTDAAAERSI